MIVGPDNNLYGTSLYGGASGWGTVYRLTTNSVLTSLFAFNLTDGANPAGALTLGRDGKFYGVTFYGGTNTVGTVYTITTNGTLAIVASLNYYLTGGYPQTGLLQGSDGNFYGTTFYGGMHGLGTLYSMTTNGTLSTLVAFNGTNGALPEIGAGLVEGTDANLYGVTYYGGAGYNGNVSSGDGVVYRLGTVSGGAPVIVTQPNNQNAAVGGTATFTVSASGAGPLSYTWLRNGAPLLTATQSGYTNENVTWPGAGRPPI